MGENELWYTRENVHPLSVSTAAMIVWGVSSLVLVYISDAEGVSAMFPAVLFVALMWFRTSMHVVFVTRPGEQYWRFFYGNVQRGEDAHVRPMTKVVAGALGLCVLVGVLWAGAVSTAYAIRLGGVAVAPILSAGVILREFLLLVAKERKYISEVAINEIA